MNTLNEHKIHINNGLKAGLPVFLGYFPVAMAFGILARGTGLTFYETVAFSIFVFAGASQFVAVGMIGMGASSIEIIITTFFLNFRHFFMSASIAPKLKLKSSFDKALLSFFLTDEFFSVASFTNKQLTKEYLLTMKLLGFSGWTIGTGVGFLVGNILPLLLQQSMGVALYAMFISLIIPEIKKTNKALVLSVLSGIINFVLIHNFNLQQGWSIVLSIIIVSSIGLLLYDTNLFLKKEESVSYE